MCVHIDTYSCICLIYKHTDAYLKWMAWRDHVKKFIDLGFNSLICLLLLLLLWCRCCCCCFCWCWYFCWLDYLRTHCVEYESFSNCAKYVHVYANISRFLHSTQYIGDCTSRSLLFLRHCSYILNSTSDI